jgi:hypothetical protein
VPDYTGGRQQPPRVLACNAALTTNLETRRSLATGRLSASNPVDLRINNETRDNLVSAGSSPRTYNQTLIHKPANIRGLFHARARLKHRPRNDQSRAVYRAIANCTSGYRPTTVTVARTSRRASSPETPCGEESDRELAGTVSLIGLARYELGSTRSHAISLQRRCHVNSRVLPSSSGSQ